MFLHLLESNFDAECALVSAGPLLEGPYASADHMLFEFCCLKDALTSLNMDTKFGIML